jgi:NitT/TauT family transport system ATP-binding protein
VITVRGIVKRYGDDVVLDGLDLDLDEGGITALMGPNGSGKTTLARVLLGLAAPDGGTVRGLDGLRRAAVFQENRLCEELSAVANVRLVLDRRTPARAVADGLRAVGLAEEALDKPVAELSGGQRRRVALVRALLADADLVILDEPFTGLDAEAKAAALPFVQEHCRGRTTLLITHDPADAAFLGAPVVRLLPSRCLARLTDDDGRRAARARGDNGEIT